MQTPNLRAHVLAAVALAAIAVGCASAVYRTPGAEGKSAADIAILEEPSPPVVTVGAIDGKSRPWGIFERYELAPGQHMVSVRLVKGGATVNSDPFNIEFTAESGKSYVLMGSAESTGPNGGKWRAWIVSKDTGKTVSRPAVK
jgi:hypothetical protein